MILKPRPFRKPNLGLPISRGIVGLWLFNEGSGGQVFDLSGNGNIGTFGVAAPVWVSGKHGSALKFNASNDVVNCVTNITYPNDELTAICAGSRSADDADIENIFTQGEYYEASSAFSMRVYQQNRVSFSVHRNFIYKDDTNLATEWPLNETVVWAISYKKGSWGKVYRNGVFWGNFNDYSDSIPTTYDVRIGNNRNEDEGWKDNNIEYACIYNRALSASEIALPCREPFCMFERDPIELWSAATLGVAPPAGMAGAMTTNTGYWGW